MASPGSADLVIVANRLPVDRVERRTARWAGNARPVAGVRPRAGHAGQRRHLDRLAGWHRAGLEPFEDQGMQLVPMSLTAEEIEEFYEGFSTPRSGRSTTTSSLSRSSTASGGTHVAVNRRFAERAAEVAADATVWVHDYQLQLVPAMLRELRPTCGSASTSTSRSRRRSSSAAAVASADPRGPARRRPGRVPARRRGAELRAPGAPAGRPQDPPRPGVPPRRPHRSARAAFPISIDVEALRESLARSEEVTSAPGDPRGGRQPAQDLPGVDRLDYTRGIYARLRAFGELLEEGPSTSRTRCSSRWPRPRANRSSSTASRVTTSSGWSGV